MSKAPLNLVSTTIYGDNTSIDGLGDPAGGGTGKEGVFLVSRLANIHFYKSCRKSQLFVVELKRWIPRGQEENRE